MGPYLTANPAEQDELAHLDAMFRLAVDHPLATTWRANADQAYKFEHGDQWTSEEKAELNRRGQPVIVENEIRPTLERLQGQFRRQKTTIKFVGRNTSDEQKAAGNSDLLRHIDYVNQFEFVEGQAMKDQLIGGIGWIEVFIKPNELGQPQVCYRHEDPFTMFPDPFCRTYDLNQEARYVCRAKWINEDDAVAMWGEDKAKLIASVLDTSHPSQQALSSIDPTVLDNRNWEIGRYYDVKNHRFRPVEIWYKKRATQYDIKLPDGRTATVIKRRGTEKQLNDALLQMPGASVTERSIDQLWVAVFCGGVLLDGPKPSPYRCHQFPFIPYYCYRKPDGEPQGYAWGLMDPQREINARRSKALWALNNRQTIYEEGAIKDPNKLAEELASMDGQIEVRPGKFDRFSVKENTDISQGNLAMLQEAKMAIRRISGEDQLNPAPEVRSGVGIQRLQMIHSAGVLPIYDNIRRSRRMKAKLTFELVKQYYTDEMIFQITEDPNIVRTVRLTEDHFASLQELIYDLVAVDTIDYSTAQSEQFETLATTLPQILQFGPAWGKLLISMSELRNKDGLLQLIDQITQPPPVQPKAAVSFQWNELTADEKTAVAMEFKWQTLAQVTAGTQPEPTSLTQNKAEIIKMKMRTDADVQKAVITAKGQVATATVGMEKDALKAMTDLHMQERDHAHEKSMPKPEATNGA